MKATLEFGKKGQGFTCKVEYPSLTLAIRTAQEIERMFFGEGVNPSDWGMLRKANCPCAGWEDASHWIVITKEK